VALALLNRRKIGFSILPLRSFVALGEAFALAQNRGRAGLMALLPPVPE
jgi:hypothetical protein